MVILYTKGIIKGIVYMCYTLYIGGIILKNLTPVFVRSELRYYRVVYKYRECVFTKNFNVRLLGLFAAKQLGEVSIHILTALDQKGCESNWSTSTWYYNATKVLDQLEISSAQIAPEFEHIESHVIRLEAPYVRKVLLGAGYTILGEWNYQVMVEEMNQFDEDEQAEMLHILSGIVGFDIEFSALIMPHIKKSYVFIKYKTRTRMGVA